MLPGAAGSEGSPCAVEERLFVMLFAYSAWRVTHSACQVRARIAEIPTCRGMPAIGEQRRSAEMAEWCKGARRLFRREMTCWFLCEFILQMEWISGVIMDRRCTGVVTASCRRGGARPIACDGVRGRLEFPAETGFRARSRIFLSDCRNPVNATAQYPCHGMVEPSSIASSFVLGADGCLSKVRETSEEVPGASTRIIGQEKYRASSRGQVADM